MGTMGRQHPGRFPVIIASCLAVGSSAPLLSATLAAVGGSQLQQQKEVTQGEAPESSQVESLSTPPLSARFVRSATPAAPNLVRLVERSRSGKRVTIGVVINGMTSSRDIYSYAFDLVTSGSPIRLIETATSPGNALSLGAGQAVMARAKQVGDRIVVGVTKTGGGVGNGQSVGKATIVKLTFAVLEKGSTSISFAPPSVRSDIAAAVSGPAALDSRGQPLPEVAFDQALGTIKARLR